jgi:threonine dehydrogenase-like Zn-dependent dehydrogenase
VDCEVEAVGYQAHDAGGQEHPEMVLDKLIEVVRATGRIGVAGVYNPEDPGVATEGARQGRYGFNYGLVFDKAISMGHGQCPVKRYNHQLRDLIICGKASPSLIVSHELPLDWAQDAYAGSTSARTAGPRSCSSPATRPPDGSARRGAGAARRSRRRPWFSRPGLAGCWRGPRGSM